MLHTPFFQTTGGIGSSESVAPPVATGDSTLVQAEFIVDGSGDPFTPYQYRSLQAAKILAFSVDMRNLRLAGVLMISLYINGSLVVGSTLTINNSAPISSSNLSLSEDVSIGDLLEVRVTTTGYSPLANVGLASFIIGNPA